MSDDDNGSDDEQPKGNIFMQQAAMKSKMNLDDQKKKTCQGCKKDVWPNQEKIMPVKDQYYHAECFKCEVCKNRLPSGKFSALKGHFYCTPHYTELLKAAGGKVDAVVNTDRNKIEQAREAARTTASTRVAGIKSAEDEGRGANWQAAKGTAKASDAAGRAEVAKQRDDERKAADRAKASSSSSGQALRAKFAPPKPNFERTSVGDAPAKPAAKAAFKPPAPAASSSSSSASSAPKAGGVSSAAAKFAAPKVAAAPPAKPAPVKASAPPPGRAASPGGRGKFSAPAPKFEVDEEEERRKREEEEERRRREEEEAARAREEEESRQREEEESRQREEEEARQRAEEEERQRAEEEERQRAEAEAASQQQSDYNEEAPPSDEPPPEDQQEFQPTAGKRWERIEHEDGDVYFYNHETGESVWEQPEDYDG